ncbi:MAG TPA: GMC family oxidoreductase [Candidatus Acidoferrum sp.]|jgi:choline dehydrogenase-like flavoprotein|nr:GMC family oxidoreductase [Candidatus Acidoferrum sp.]
MSDDFDYVIVGSGAAGATAARVLADSTTSVAVVEEGPAVATDEFVDQAFPTLARIYRRMGVQVTRGRAPMLIIQGRCLGGSTVINSAIMRRLPEDVWKEWADLHGLGSALPYDAVERASDSIDRELQAEATPEPVWGGNNRLLNAAAIKANLSGGPTRRNAPGCRGSARCNLGCPHGAKQSMQVSYLPYARSKGTQLFTDERVERVIWRGTRAAGVQTAKRTLTANKAVLIAASAVQTPGLLWRSGLRNRHLGRHFQGHPGMAVVGLFDHPVGLGDGATQGFEVDGLRGDARVKLETLATPPETFFGGMPGTGRDWVELMAEFPRAAVWVLPLRAYGEGVVTRSGSPRFELDPRDLPNLRRGLRRAADLMFEVGARDVVCPIYGLPQRLHLGESALIESAPDDPAAYPLAMSHLFGTARMSPMPEAGVVGTDFRVHGTENLYVVDSSVFPTNLGVNPQLSIMALARLAAERLVA